MTCCNIVVLARRTRPSQPGEVGGDLDEVGVCVTAALDGRVYRSVCEKEKKNITKSTTRITNTITPIPRAPAGPTSPSLRSEQDFCVK